MPFPRAITQSNLESFMDPITSSLARFSQRFFRQFLLLLGVKQMAGALFRLIAAVGRSMIIANIFGSFALLTILVLGGFILSKDAIRPWWIWGYWISPLMYGQNAISANEYLGKSWQHVNSTTGESLGVAVMEARSLFPHAYGYWLNRVRIL